MTYDWEASCSPAPGTPNPHLGTRFDAKGRFLPEPGNTIVAQVIPGSPTQAALIDLRAELMALPHAHHFAFTAVESYHMTLFEGVIDTRRKPGFWPADLPLGASIEQATAHMANRLKGWTRLPDFAMQTTAVVPFGLRLAGATGQDEGVARAWRNALADALGFRTPSHDSYGFHTTLAYVKDWLPPEALAPYRSAMARFTAAFSARVPVLHLARPAFCRFEDMNAFPAVLEL
jgi:hypothetical protein